MKARLVVAAIEMAIARRGDVAGCILHSDRGSQFRSRKVHRALARHGLVGSMGQVGSVGDNAAMESFFALLEKNVLDRRHRWETTALTPTVRDARYRANRSPDREQLLARAIRRFAERRSEAGHSGQAHDIVRYRLEEET